MAVETLVGAACAKRLHAAAAHARVGVVLVGDVAVAGTEDIRVGVVVVDVAEVGAARSVLANHVFFGFPLLLPDLNDLFLSLSRLRCIGNAVPIA